MLSKFTIFGLEHGKLHDIKSSILRAKFANMYG